MTARKVREEQGRFEVHMMQLNGLSEVSGVSYDTATAALRAARLVDRSDCQAVIVLDRENGVTQLVQVRK